VRARAPAQHHGPLLLPKCLRASRRRNVGRPERTNGRSPRLRPTRARLRLGVGASDGPARSRLVRSGQREVKSRGKRRRYPSSRTKMVSLRTPSLFSASRPSSDSSSSWSLPKSGTSRINPTRLEPCGSLKCDGVTPMAPRTSERVDAWSQYSTSSTVWQTGHRGPVDREHPHRYPWGQASLRASPGRRGSSRRVRRVRPARPAASAG
jgi:hypothetical protein